MSHLHIPDGVLPVWLWLAGWALTAALVWLASRKLTTTDARRSVPLIGVVSALVLVAMSSEIVPLAYHINLTVLAGVLLGPWAGVISAFIVVLALALLGHGGITVVGLNALVIATEMALGWALVRGGARVIRRAKLGRVAAAATVLTLALTTTMVVGIVALGGTAAMSRETGALDPETLQFNNPFTGGVLSIGLLAGGEHADAADAAGETAGSAGAADAEPTLAVGRFAAVVYTLGPLGWLLEALVTGAIVGYIGRVRPSLLFGGADWRPRLPGDEHGRR